MTILRRLLVLSSYRLASHVLSGRYPQLQSLLHCLRKLCVTILGPTTNFPPFFYHFIPCSWSFVPHSFPHASLGPLPNHLKSHLIDHLTIPQSTIICHHSAVRSILLCHHLTPFGLPAHDVLFLDRQLMMEPYLELPCHDTPYQIFPYFFVTPVTRYFSFVYKRSYF